MRRVSRSLRLILLIAIGGALGGLSARASGPPDAAGAFPEGQHPIHRTRPGTVWAPQIQPVEPTPVQPVRDCWRWINGACWAHHNAPASCGNLLSELRFGFGSCKAWYGEPCTGNAPAVPLPGGGYGVIPGVWNTRCPDCP
jgi:hypothetical protein